MDLRARVVSALRWSIIGRVISQIVTWAVTIYVIRLLAPEDYALMALVALILGLAELIRELGLSEVIIQRDNLNKDDFRTIFGLLISSHLVLLMLIYFIAPGMANFFDSERLELVVRVASVVLLIQIFGVIPCALLDRAMRFKWTSLVTLIGAVTSSLVVLGMVYAGFGVWSLVGGYIVGTVVSTIGFQIGEPYIKWPSFRFGRARSFIAYSSRVMGSKILYYFYTHADVVVVGKILGTTLLGYYTVSYNLATLPMNKITGILSSVGLSAYVQIKHDIPEIKSKFLYTIEINSLVFFPVLWGLSSVAGDFVPVVLGEKWIPSIIVLQLITLIIPMQMTGPLNSPIMLAIGRADLLMARLLTNVICVPIAIAIGSIWWGLAGTCLGWIVGFLLAYYINLRRFLPILNCNLVEYGRVMAPAALMALVMYFVVAVTKVTVLNSIDPIHRLYLSVLIGATVYSGLLLIFRRDAFVRILSLVKG